MAEMTVGGTVLYWVEQKAEWRAVLKEQKLVDNLAEQ
jgi:hypothetical protein